MNIHWQCTPVQALATTLCLGAVVGAWIAPQAALGTGGVSLQTANSVVGANGAPAASPIPVCANRTNAKPSGCGAVSAPGTSVGGSKASGSGLHNTVPTMTSNKSYIDNLTFNYVHWSNDFNLDSNHSSCSSCGEKSPEKTGVPAVGLLRKHRFRNECESGSFGVGGFSAYTDKRVSFIQMNGGVSVTVFDPNSDVPILLVDGLSGDVLDGIYNDKVNVSVKEARLLDASGAVTASLSNARFFDVIAYDGQVSRFEVVVATPPEASVATPNDPSLLAQWKLDETGGVPVVDATGHAAHTGAFSPTSPFGVAPGHTGQPGDYALHLAEGNQNIQLGTGASLGGTTDLTVSAWVKTTRNGVVFYQCAKEGGGSAGYNGQYALYIEQDGKVWFSLYGNYAYQFAFGSPQAVNDGQWHLLTAKRAGLVGTLFIDGVQVASATGSAVRALDAQIAATIGADSRNNCLFFVGDLDDVRVYSRALTSTEIANLQAGIEPAATGLMGRWKMDDAIFGTGGALNAIVADTSGRLANGTVQPAPVIPAVVAGRTAQTGDNALRFNGSNRVSIGNPADLNFGGAITMTAWVKPEASDLGNILSHCYNNSASPAAYAEVVMKYAGGKFQGGVQSGTATPQLVTFVPPPSAFNGSTWTHLATQYDGKNWRMYVNGVLSAMLPSTTGAIPVNADWSIGAASQPLVGWGASPPEFRGFKGAIDDVRVYNRALGDAEIYALGSSRTTYSGRLLSITDTKGYGLGITYKYNPVSNPSDAAATNADPALLYQMVASADSQGNTVAYTYAPTQLAGGYVVSRADFSNGEHATYTYGDGLHLTRVDHPDGSASTFNYAVSGNMTTVSINDVSADAGHEKKTVYLSNQIAIDPKNVQSQEEWLQAAALWNQSALTCRMIQNGAGEVSYLSFYDAAINNLGCSHFYEGGNKIKWACGVWVENFYQDGAQVAIVSGKPVVQGAAQETVAASVDAGTAWRNEYTQKGFYPTIQDERGMQVSMIYDTATFPTQKTYADGTKEIWIYDANHNVTSYTDRAGRITTTTYDSRNNLLTRTEGAGSDAGTWTYAYYPVGNPNQYLLKSVMDPNGNTTDYAYDANHRLLTKTLPADVAGGTRPVYSYQYDNAGRLSRSTDPVGRYVELTYDGRNRVIRKDYCGVSHEETVYGTGDNANRVMAQSDRDGNWMAYRYDADGRVIRTISGIGNQADAVNPALQPDTAYHAVTDYAYLSGCDLVAFSVRNGEKTAYAYDYRNREVSRTVYSGKLGVGGNPVGLTTTSTYVQNALFSTTDPYGLRTYYNYRVTDMRLVRKVTETVPGGVGAIGTATNSGGNMFPAVAALTRSTTTVNAPYVIEDYTLDVGGLQTAMTDARGLVSQTTYDSRGRATLQKVAVNTPVQAQSQTIYDPAGNVIEQDSVRYFDGTDLTGYQKSKTVMTYTGRNLLASKTESPGQMEAGTTTYTYYLDGKQATATLPLGNVSGATSSQKEAQTTIQMNRPLCGWALGNVDQAGHGTLTNTSIGGDVVHTIQVKDLKGLTATVQGLVVPNFLNETSMDVPGANTIGESTMQYDTRHRPIAMTVWGGPLGAVYRNDPPAYWSGQVQGGANAQAAVPQGTSGQTTLYYYSENLSASQLTKKRKTLNNLAIASAGKPQGIVKAIDGSLTTINGLTLTHSFGPSINLQPLMQQLTNAGLNVLVANISNASAKATINPAGEITASIQDGLGRPVIQAHLDKTTNAPVSWNVVVHDQMDPATGLRMTMVKTALGNTTIKYADGLGYVRKIVDAKGQVSTAAYDNDGNLVQTRDANGIGQDCMYDQQNRKVSCADTQGGTTAIKYSVGGLMLNQQDGKGVFWCKDATYDSRGRMTSKTTKLDNSDTTYFTYDVNGNRLTVTDAEGKQTGYAYDVRNLKIAWTFPGQTSTTVGASGYDTVTYSYDAAARLVQFMRQAGQSEVNTYAFNGTLTQKQFLDASGNPVGQDSFQYDPNNRLTQAIKGRYNNTVQIAYDQIGRKQSETLLLGTPGSSTATYTTQYAYDQDNRNTQITYPDGQIVAKNHDQRNQVTGVSLSTQNVASFTYDNGGREIARTLGNGVTQDSVYRNDNLLSTIMVSRGGGNDASLGASYAYDVNQNLTGEIFGGNAASFSTTLVQDAKDRLTQYSRTNGETTNWTLTKEGDWTQEAGSASGSNFVQTRMHNDKHQIISITGSLTATPIYDAQGDLTQDEQGRTYTWDQEKNLIGITGGGMNEGYAYDALGRRMSVTSSGNTMVFVSVGSQEVQEYAQGSMVPTKTYVHGNGYVDDVVLEVQGSGANATPLYHLSDRRYSTMALLDGTGSTVERYVYDPYGKVTVLDTSGAVKASAPHTAILWTGRRLDGAGNYYFRSRYFSSTLGRFISQDVDYLDGMSLYAGYFAMSETIDPSGMMTPEEFDRLTQAAKDKWFSGMKKRIGSLIEQSAEKYCVPEELLWDVIMNEQLDNIPWRQFMKEVIGGDSSIGLARMKPSTFIDNGLKLPPGEIQTKKEYDRGNEDVIVDYAGAVGIDISGYNEYVSNSIRKHLISDAGAIDATGQLVSKYMKELCDKSKKCEISKSFSDVSTYNIPTGMDTRPCKAKDFCVSEKTSDCKKIAKQKIPPCLAKGMVMMWNNGSKIATDNDIMSHYPNASNHSANLYPVLGTWRKY